MDFGYGAFTRCGRTFQTVLLSITRATSRSRNPGKQAFRFSLIRVRSPLLTESQLMSSPRGTEMFHFPRYSFRPLCIQGLMAELLPPGFPIRTPPDQNRLLLPGAFRSELRPSSPYGAKASVVCPYTLDRNGSLRFPVYTLQFFTQIMLLSKNSASRITARLADPRIAWKSVQDQFKIFAWVGHGSVPRNFAGPVLTELVGVTGIGPVTSSLSGTRSNQLSYTPSEMLF